MEERGIVYLVGAGPGDPGLLTVKGMELLKSCDAVVYDHLASGSLLQYVPAACKKVYVGKEAGRHSMKQEEINQVLAELAGQGLKVVRLKGGDPFVFGRGGEEALALEEKNMAYELVPGVTSAVAVPEYAGIPVTHRSVSRSFHVITGHTREGEDCLPPGFEIYGKLPGTLVFLMGLNHLPHIIRKLEQGGKSPDTPAAVIEKGTLPGQRVVRAPLKELAERVHEAGLETPAIIVVGDVACFEMRSALSRPMSGLCVGITGTQHFAEKIGAALEAEGASARRFLDMEVISWADKEPMQSAYRNLQQYGWIVLTSANGVRLFFRGLMDSGRDHRALGHLKFAVIGDGTRQELASYGFIADYMPDKYCGEDLAQGLAGLLAESGETPGRILIPRAKGGSPRLTQILGDAGLPFDDVLLYQVAGRPMEEWREAPDYLVFASASGVQAFFDHLSLPDQKRYLADARYACIGSVTARALREKTGQESHVVAETYDIPGLVQAIKQDALRYHKR